jgi:hypothetical protein
VSAGARGVDGGRGLARKTNHALSHHRYHAQHTNAPARLVGGLDVMRDMGDELADVLKE